MPRFKCSAIKSGQMPVPAFRQSLANEIVALAKDLQPGQWFTIEEPPTTWKAALETVKEAMAHIDGYKSTGGMLVIHHKTKDPSTAPASKATVVNTSGPPMLTPSVPFKTTGEIPHRTTPAAVIRTPLHTPSAPPAPAVAPSAKAIPKDGPRPAIHDKWQLKIMQHVPDNGDRIMVSDLRSKLGGNLNVDALRALIDSGWLIRGVNETKHHFIERKLTEQ